MIIVGNIRISKELLSVNMGTYRAALVNMHC